MWCLFMASGVVPLPPGDGRGFRTCSLGTRLAIWTTSTAGPPPGCPRMCLKPACSLWNTQPLPQAGRSAIPCCIHCLIATNAYQVHHRKHLCHVLRRPLLPEADMHITLFVLWLPINPFAYSAAHYILSQQFCNLSDNAHYAFWSMCHVGRRIARWH